jgi:DnaJ-class molecular chaperone
MNNLSYHRDLNLKVGASLDEIKAAYRKMAKTHHPDSNSGSGSGGDPEKFKRANAAYRALVKELKSGLGGPDDDSDAKRVPLGAPYVFNGVKNDGLDVLYEIIMARPMDLGEVVLDLPWTKKEACPRCLGEGVLLKRSGNGFVYKPHRCEKCEGKGVAEEKSRIKITVSTEALSKGKIRVKNAGSYRPKTSERGDLIVNVELRDKLPREN